MLDWLTETMGRGDPLTIDAIAVRLALAFVYGCLVTGIYHLTHGRGGRSAPGFTATLVLLAVLIGMVALVIGNNVARAFSLVGALAIVRFRTVVEDTRDTAFVIFAVAVGMSAGAGLWDVPLVAMPIAGLAAFLFRPAPRPAAGSGGEAKLTVRVGLGPAGQTLVEEVLRKHATAARVTNAATARQGAALDLTYAVRLRSDAAATVLVNELNGREGVQSVELRLD
jgi:uncharacterized membrane protein YhiD involved in acid resistance